MVFLGNNILYVDASCKVDKVSKISFCDLLRVYFYIVLPGPLHVSDVVYAFELIIYAKQPEMVYPKGHDTCGGASTLIACRCASD